jgi:hypothetical protein
MTDNNPAGLISWAEIVHTLLWLFGITSVVVLAVRGVLPALYRLGTGLATRRIAIFAAPAAYGELSQLLIDSKLFKPGNITHVHSPAEIDVASSASVFLVFWPDWGASLDALLSARRPNVPCIIYAPQARGLIERPDMNRLDEHHRHTIVTNFRGRLLNDIVTAMIATGYER